jgi:prepilin-type N-terminal cleavage/methylation domain-containing protein
MMFLSNYLAPCSIQMQGRRLFNSRIEVSGFSLIELMVVMAIMAVLMGLSGGLMQSSINKQAKQVELEQVSQLFKALSYKAYYGMGAVNVRLEKNQIHITYGGNTINADEQDTILQNKDEPLNSELPAQMNDIDLTNKKLQEVESITFEQLTFVAQDYQVSSKGIVTPAQYQILDLGTIKTFELNLLFSEPAL